MKKIFAMVACLALISSSAGAKVDLVTLPKRDSVQLTIYNSADLTLVREQRLLTLKRGLNKLQFSWANTLIDPTSLEMLAKANADKINIFDLTYPPRVENLGLWNIQSDLSGDVPVEITYLTSGFSWRAFYQGILSPDEKEMRLEAFVRVSNNSGEDYENAQTRLIVGKVHILDEIAALARRKHPYGQPQTMEEESSMGARGKIEAAKISRLVRFESVSDLQLVKEIAKEGLSEYFLYTIDGTETIPNGWSKRLPSFDQHGVPVVNLYKFEEERYGPSVVHFLSFKNDKAHKLGATPIPGGTIMVFRLVPGSGANLGYEGRSEFKYIPVDEDVELNLGVVRNVIVEPRMMDYSMDNLQFDNDGNISGWDEIREFRIDAKNTRDLPVKVEIMRNIPTISWDMAKDGEFGEYEKVDLNTVKFTILLDGRSKKEFKYVLTTHHGTRAE